MRQRAGMILCVTGIVLLVKPNFDFEQIIYQLNYVIVHYWPVFLVITGFMMMGKKQSRKHK